MEELVRKYSKRPIKGDIYTLTNLKALLDDLLNEYLSGEGFRRKYFYTDVKNGIGLLSAVLALVVTGLSVYCEFQRVKPYIGLCIGAYFLLYVLNYLVSYREGGRFYYDGFEIVTRADAVPVYVLLVYRRDRPVPQKYTRSVLDLFDAEGRLDHEYFLGDIKPLFTR